MSILLAKTQAKGMSCRDGALGEYYSYNPVLDGDPHTHKQTNEKHDPPT